MKIGIIIHSFTGNTALVAQRIQEKLLEAGHSVKIENVAAIGETRQTYADFTLEKAPDVSPYDVLIFGAPVRGFSLSPVMAAYLSKITPIRGKIAACFVTQLFPYAWMGGNRAVSQLKKYCESKGTSALEAGIVHWSSKRREKQIADVADRLSRLLVK